MTTVGDFNGFIRKLHICISGSSLMYQAQDRITLLVYMYWHVIYVFDVNLKRGSMAGEEVTRFEKLQL